MLNIEIDKDIINGCQLHQQQAQECLYKLCYTDFMRICLRYTHSYEDASNILHDSFIKIFTKIATFSGSGDIVGWMKRIVVNTCIDYNRAKKQEGMVSIDTIPDVAGEDDEETKFVVDEKQLLIFIRQLPILHAEVFNLFVMEDYSHEEIGGLLGISVATSKWYLFSARKVLREKIFKLITRE